MKIATGKKLVAGWIELDGNVFLAFTWATFSLALNYYNLQCGLRDGGKVRSENWSVTFSIVGICRLHSERDRLWGKCLADIERVFCIDCCLEIIECLVLSSRVFSCPRSNHVLVKVVLFKKWWTENSQKFRPSLWLMRYCISKPR